MPFLSSSLCTSQLSNESNPTFHSFKQWVILQILGTALGIHSLMYHALHDHSSHGCSLYYANVLSSQFFAQSKMLFTSSRTIKVCKLHSVDFLWPKLRWIGSREIIVLTCYNIYKCLFFINNCSKLILSCASIDMISSMGLD
jgi:hypothetical protein